MPWKCDGKVLMKQSGGRWLTKQVCESEDACQRLKRYLYAQEESGGRGKGKGRGE